MEDLQLFGKVKRIDWLSIPVSFSQGKVFNKKTKHLLCNRDVKVEYNYDISFKFNHELTQRQKFEIKNALTSLITIYGDKICYKDFLLQKMNNSFVGLEKIIEDSEININYFSKRYLICNSKNDNFVSDYEIFVDNKINQEVEIS